MARSERAWYRGEAMDQLGSAVREAKPNRPFGERWRDWAFEIAADRTGGRNARGVRR